MDSTRRTMPGRLLRLLALLQARRHWPGDDLARALDVSARTLRRDVERLRELDYPVVGTTGHAGGYRLAAGRAVPPLALEEDEAVAVAVGLVTASGVEGIGDSALSALAKLERTLPTRLRPRLAAVGAAAALPARHLTAPPVDSTTLATLAACCRDAEIVSFDYRDRNDTSTTRRVEPHSLVTVQGHWYLIAFDPTREDWRTFRVDRVESPTRTHRPVTPRDLDAAAHLRRSFTTARYRHTATITVELPADAVRSRLLAPVIGDIEPTETGCVVTVSADDPDLVVQYIAAVASLGAPFTLATSDDIAARVTTLGRALAR